MPNLTELKFPSRAQRRKDAQEKEQPVNNSLI